MVVQIPVGYMQAMILSWLRSSGRYTVTIRECGDVFENVYHTHLAFRSNITTVRTMVAPGDRVTARQHTLMSVHPPTGLTGR